MNNDFNYMKYSRQYSTHANSHRGGQCLMAITCYKDLIMKKFHFHFSCRRENLQLNLHPISKGIYGTVRAACACLANFQHRINLYLCKRKKLNSGRLYSQFIWKEDYSCLRHPDKSNDASGMCTINFF